MATALLLKSGETVSTLSNIPDSLKFPQWKLGRCHTAVHFYLLIVIKTMLDQHYLVPQIMKVLSEKEFQ